MCQHLRDNRSEAVPTPGAEARGEPGARALDHPPGAAAPWLRHPAPEAPALELEIRFQSDLPNGTWQSDMTRWHLEDDQPEDDQPVEIINFVDDYSRNAESAQGVVQPERRLNAK
jgi:hypothetical protein